ncbi:26s proteasome non-atpase regulatory subunit 4 [Anaeramoeba flamelloides]|uniref:26s proteasome non-atpase regulatory subunit 4 n=1 Tax=Anaeramoeba flamelloides TaxID=1746091 RepID=A0ABQ8YTP6_9EUKA|nr:26s proteasome non-atpase regulatory subunit 4 [Anaeramoeba flamelloides]
MEEEITLVILDNSKFGNKKDFKPNRFDSQLNSLTEISFSLTQTNELHKVGLLVVSQPKTLLVEASNDIGDIFGCISDLETVSEGCNYFAVVNFAAETLVNYCKEKTKLRIILFVAGEIKEESEEISKTATLLKKNLIQIDIISFGNDQTGQEKLDHFQNILNDENSRFVLLDPNSNNDVSKQIENSGILQDAIIKIEEETNENNSNLLENTDFNVLEQSLEQDRLYQQRIINGVHSETINVNENLLNEKEDFEVDEELLQKAFEMSVMNFDEIGEYDRKREEELERVRQKQRQRQINLERERKRQQGRGMENQQGGGRKIEEEKEIKKEKEIEKENEIEKEKEIETEKENEINKEIEVETEKETETEKEIEIEEQTQIQMIDSDSETDEIMKHLEDLPEEDQLKYVLKMSMGSLTEEEMKQLTSKKEKSDEIEKEIIIEPENTLPTPIKDPKINEIMSNWDYVRSVLKQIPKIDVENKIIKDTWNEIYKEEEKK